MTHFAESLRQGAEQCRRAVEAERPYFQQLSDLRKRWSFKTFLGGRKKKIFVDCGFRSGILSGLVPWKTR